MVAANAVFLTFLAAPGFGRADSLRQDPDAKASISYVDPDSGAMFRVESDGLLLTKRDRTGQIVWTKDLRAEAGVPDYRHLHPRLMFVGAPLRWMMQDRPDKHRRYLAVSYDNSQFGLVDIETGAFYMLGQD